LLHLFPCSFLDKVLCPKKKRKMYKLIKKRKKKKMYKAND